MANKSARKRVIKKATSRKPVKRRVSKISRTKINVPRKKATKPLSKRFTNWFNS